MGRRLKADKLLIFRRIRKGRKRRLIMKITFIKGVRRNRRITALKIQSNKY
jgi:hypothetical protein